MISKSDLKQINENVWEIPRSFRADMRAPARLYAEEGLLEDALQDRSLEQLVNTATLPGIVKYAIAMPDIHQGYGFPIGGVVATKLPDGIISPGGVGYDINCGVRLLASGGTVEEVSPFLEDLATALYHNCPSGVGVHGEIKLKGAELDEVLTEGARWAKRRGYARQEDLDHTEEFGTIPGADPAYVSDRAKQRGHDQIGTLGAGNHFIEVDKVTQIYDSNAAERLGLFPGQVVVQIHCGSRGFGHQVCEDYVARFQKTVRDYGIELPDRELVCAPFESKEGQEYFRGMACSANFAFANRQVLAHNIRRSFEQVLAGKVQKWDLHQVYDIAHNMAKVEEHDVNGKETRVCVHRKGATRAFGPGSPGLSDDLRDLGQPVLIPGSMGTASYVLIGTPGSMEQTFGSTCHGAGRVMSRAKAKKTVRGERLKQELQARGIVIRAGSMSGLAEEAPQAYKDVSQVVEVVARAGIGKKVARLEPMAVIKG
ncbi:MAG TPA: RtcB family protein [Terriglobales bacterium]|nr:RtcB family protein [Terriglobales bacterium]